MAVFVSLVIVCYLFIFFMIIRVERDKINKHDHKSGNTHVQICTGRPVVYYNAYIVLNAYFTTVVKNILKLIPRYNVKI